MNLPRFSLPSTVELEFEAIRIVVRQYHISLGGRLTLGHVTFLAWDETAGVFVQKGLHVAEMLQVPRLGPFQCYLECSIYEYPIVEGVYDLLPEQHHTLEQKYGIWGCENRIALFSGSCCVVENLRLVAKASFRPQWFEDVFADRRVIKGVLDIPLDRHRTSSMPDFGRIVKTVDAGANHLAIHFSENYRQFVCKDGLPGCADPVYPHSERVGKFDCRQPIGDSLQDFRSRLILHVSINEREFFIINNETNGHPGIEFRNF
jgi:hypothetical protein